MKKKRRIFAGVLLLAIVAWLLLIWRLSSADGTETLHDSMQIARKICAVLYDNPTYEQLSHVNLKLRKLAHIFLYLVLGGFSTLFWHLLIERWSPWTRSIPAFLCCTVIAFLDELQKIPIEGRHFSLSESILNAGSALCMIVLCTFIIVWIIRRHRIKQY